MKGVKSGRAYIFAERFSWERAEMFTRQKYLCWIVLVIAFIAVISSGCGGGGGSTGSVSQSDNLP